MRAIEQYLSDLRRELVVQFRSADIDRIVEEVEAFLLEAMEESQATSDSEIEQIIVDFGSAADVGRAYRRSGIRRLGLDAAASQSQPTKAALDLSRTPAPRPQLMDLINLGHIFRNLIRKPSFTLVTVATLAIGIGANAVILSVVNGVLLQPLPFPDADRLIRVYHSAPGMNIDRDDIGLSIRTYFFFRDSGVLEDLAIFSRGNANLSGGDSPQRVESISVSHSYFDTLGVPPALGRTFNVDDEAADAASVIILSDALWRGNFGSRPDVIGERLLMDGEQVEIVGVMPESLKFPDADPRLYEPMTLVRDRQQLGSLGTASIGRLPAGLTAEAAGAQLAARIENLTEVFPDEPAAPILAQLGLTAHAIDLRNFIVGDAERMLWVLMGSVGFVLMIACANVANVFLVRAEGREREMAIRSAMGASRGRLAVGLLAESAVLGLVAGGVGLLLAFAGVRALVRWGPQQVPRLEEIGIDGTVLGLTVLVSLVAGLLFGVIPALRYNMSWLGGALKEGGRANTAGRSRFRVRGMLVGAQVALVLILLVGSGLMVRSLSSLSALDPGFDTDSLLTFQVMLNPRDYEGEQAPAAFIQRVVDEIGDMPGVEAVAATSRLPLAGGVSGTGLFVEEFPLDEDESIPIYYFKYAAPGYFEAMGTSLVAGRTFVRADHEDQRPSVIVNESLARLYWPDGNAVGKRVQQGGGGDPNPDTWYTIVGVVGDVRGIPLEDDPLAMMYYPLMAQKLTDDDGNRVSQYWEVRNPQFAVRTTGNPTALTQPIRERIWSIDPNLPIARVQTMSEYVDQAMAQKSFAMVLLLVGAAGALLIGAVGIYGVISYVVSQQTREIGVRMALGARTGDIGWMVLSRSLITTGAGIAIGFVGAYFLTRLMTSLLFGVNPLDPLTFVTVTVTLMGVAALAAYLPARRAARIDPLEALRQE